MKAMILHGTVSLESEDAPLEWVDLPMPVSAANEVLVRHPVRGAKVLVMPGNGNSKGTPIS